MKKVIIACFAMAAILGLVAVSQTRILSAQSQLLITNVDALAQEEDGNWVLSSTMGEVEYVI